MKEQDEFDGIEPIAIVGMSCRFPDAGNIDEYWRNLQEGKESVSFFSDEELLAGGIDREVIENPAYVNAACIIDDIDMFDYSFFGYSEAEAELIDPQQRIFMECAYKALEDAGYLSQTYGGDIGIFGGMRASGYAKILGPLFKYQGTLRCFEAVLGTSVDQVCLRASHALNLTGPSVGVQTACSASIVAVHMASESLRNGECDMALAGASAFYVPQKQGYLYDKEMINSDDGHCRAFDSEAQGIIPGNGAGMVVLKRLSDAIEDKDHIYAVIRGSALNNDGSSKMGYRTPSVEGQRRVIEEALLISNVNAETISYVEANGTGTFLGDSMEIEALNQVFRTQTDKKGFCGIGSVKSNIGHLTQAAGIAALIKTALALHHKTIPPSLNCKTPNPKLQGSPFYVVREPKEWTVDEVPRRAGLNAFAIGGTNAHIILEEAPLTTETEEKSGDESCHILTISAKSQNALENMAARYDRYLKVNGVHSIGDICLTSNIGRYHYPHRISAVADSRTQLQEQISALVSGKNPVPGLWQQTPQQLIPKIAFVFSKIHSGFISTARNNYEKHPQFKEAIDQCAVILKTDYGKSCLYDMFNDPGREVSDFKSTTHFALAYAFSNMWRSWGVMPSVIMGYGIGEYAAACVSGIFSVDDGLKLASAMEDIEGDDGGALLEAVISDMSLTSPSLELALPNARQSSENGLAYGRDELFYKIIQQAKYEFKADSFHEQGVNYIIAMGDDDRIVDMIQHDRSRENQIRLRSFSDDKNDSRQILECLGELYVMGCDIDWNLFSLNSSGKRISLPTYPFEKKSCWFTG